MRTGKILFSFLTIAAPRTVRGTQRWEWSSVNAGLMNEQSPDLCICTHWDWWGLCRCLLSSSAAYCLFLLLPNTHPLSSICLSLPSSITREFTWAQCSGAQNCRLQLLQTTWPSLLLSLPAGTICSLYFHLPRANTITPPWALPMSGVPIPKLCPKEDLPIRVLTLKTIFCMAGTLLGALFILHFLL